MIQNKEAILENTNTSNQFSEYFGILFRGRWIIVLSFLAVVATVTWLTYRMQPVYEANVSILILEIDPVEYTFRHPAEGRPNIRKSRNLNEISILRSRRIAEAVVRNLADSPLKGEIDLLKDSTASGEPITFDERVKMLREQTDVNLLKDTDVLVLSVQAPSAFEAALLANRLAEEYYRYKLRSARGEFTEIRLFLEEQLNVVRDQLSQSEDLERTYQENQGVGVLDEETRYLVEQSANFHAMYNETEAELSAELHRQDYLRRQLAETKGSLVEDVANITNPLIESLQKEIAEKQTKIASLLANRGPGTDVTVAALEKEIETIKGRLIQEVRKIAGSGVSSIDPLQTSQNIFEQILAADVEIKALTARAEALREVMTNLDYELEQLPEKKLVLARLTRDRQLNENLYLLLNEKYEETRIKEAGKQADIEIVDTAKPPEFPIRPRKTLNIILAMVFGLGLGVAITFLLEFFDDTVKTSEDLEKMGLTVLGTIPVVHTDQIVRNLKKTGRKFSESDVKRVESKLITRFSPKSPISEAYRSLRTNIQFADIDNPKRILMVTSSASKEGKSTTAVNLAVTLAQMGSRVLLIDSDLRRPALHNFFSVEKTYGLTNVLIGSLSFDDVLKKTEVDNLDLITAGDIPPNPSEMVASEAMRKLIDEAHQRYDFVVMDSPPVIAVTDAAILATRVDGTILVASSGFISKREVSRAVSLMKNVRSKIMGVVLNSLDIKRIYGSYYYYFHYYQYYYYYGSESKKRTKQKKHVRADYEEVT